MNTRKEKEKKKTVARRESQRERAKLYCQDIREQNAYCYSHEVLITLK